MRYSFLLFFFSLIHISLSAQAPQGISYQAIAFDSSGDPVIESTVGVKVSILDNSVTGTTVYSETHSPTTNTQGLFNLNIGEGAATTGSFSNIDWGTNDKFLKIEIDPSGGSNYSITGSNQLMSVPYALFSENTNVDNLPQSAPRTSSNEDGSMLVIYTDSYAYGFTRSSQNIPDWYSQQLSGTPIGAMATDSSIVVYTDSYAYGFTRSSQNIPDWYSQQLSGTPQDIVASGNTIVVYTDSYAYGFSRSGQNIPDWYSQQLSGTPQGNTINGRDVVVVYTDSYAYGFTRSSQNIPDWYSQQLSGTPLGGSASGDMIVIYTSAYAFGFTRSSQNIPDWYLQQLSGTPQGISPE